MSVLIKGMEMPETCYECPCGDNEFYECMATPGRLSYHRDEYGYPDGERQEWCPLAHVPPHGRLIDADALIAMCKTMEQIEWNNKAAPYSWAYAYESFESDIDDAQTIIEAEEGEG